MDEKLHEGLAHQFASIRLGSNHVEAAVEGEEDNDFHDLHELLKHRHPSEPRQSVVPQGSEQLLDVGVRHELNTFHSNEKYQFHQHLKIIFN